MDPIKKYNLASKLFKPFKSLFSPKNPTLNPMLTNKDLLPFGDMDNVRKYNIGDWGTYINDYNAYNLGTKNIPFSPVQTRSLSFTNPLVNNTDKKGNISMSTLQNFTSNLGAKSSGAQVEADKLLLQTTLDDLKITNPSLTDKSKIPYSLFESQVNKNIIQLNPKLSDEYAYVGMNNLGHETPNEMSGTAAPTQAEYDEQKLAWSKITNKTILFQNDKLGNPIAPGNHFPTDEFGPTYGHARFFSTDKKTFNILELQSDEMQRPLLSQLTKNESLAISKQKRLELLRANWAPNNKIITPAITQERDYQALMQKKQKEIDNLGIRNIEIGNLINQRSNVQNAQYTALEKNHSNRLFAETIKFAADNGYQTVRFPHQKTVATIEGFSTGKDTEEILVNPWTKDNVAEFDKSIADLQTGNTYGHTTVAKKHGPFVSIPVEVNSVYTMDNSPRITHQTEGWAPKKSRKPRMDVYGAMVDKDGWSYDDESYRKSLYDDGWTDPEIDEYTANIGHWKNNHISLDNDGKYTIGTRAAYGHRLENQGTQNIEIPVETAKNLQAGLYHIQDDGSWFYVGKNYYADIAASGNNQEIHKERKAIIRAYTNDIRTLNHEKLPQPDQPVFNIDDYGGVKYKKDNNEFLADGITKNPKFGTRALNKKGEPTMEREWTSHQTILRKYPEKEFAKMLKSTFGKDLKYKPVYDEKGNAWFEFDLPVNWKAGEGQIKAYSKGGEVQPYKLSKFNDGGGVDYSNTEPVDLNGQTFYRYKVKKGDTKSAISQKFGLWNEQGILNSVNNKYAADDNNYSRNINRMWADDYLLVGGPDFTSHTDYTEARGSYANSFSSMPEEELWSAITAIGHIETGSEVAYKRPTGRVYKSMDDPLYKQDNHPFTGKVESGMDDAYGFVSDANALGRFGIKETHLNNFAKEVLGYKEGQDWRGQYLKNKPDQRKLMQHLITEVYPDELVQIRHSYPEASSQYSDFELIAALHRGGQGNVKKQLKAGKFSDEKVSGDISIGGYTERVSSYLNPKVDISNSSFFMKDNPAHSFFKDIPKYKFGGSTNKEQVRGEIIGDMLENGAFLPKFKRGAEKNIQGAIGDYSIKKSYDEGRRLPYIEYSKKSESLDKNRIYYDKDDESGYDDFNILDVYKEEENRLREHNRTKLIIKKYKEGGKLSPIEMGHIRQLGVVDNQPIKENTVEEMITEQVNEGIEMPIENINASKDLYNKTDGNNKGVSLKTQIDMYSNLINGTFDQDEKFKKVKRIYNRLNSLYYNDAKASKMTVLDYMKSLNN